ncbi:Glyoxylase, beta-lactamase superfamily II [bacterium A37T11]|nr:Glyoxylase, beta-lactamase superfamily II [bacterium A37T11]
MEKRECVSLSMIIEQIYTGCLAQGAYYIESEGEAALIDPLREITPYLQRAKKNGARICYVFETHFHADFVSGHVDLAKQAGARIIYGPLAETAFDAHIAYDGEIFQLGKLKIKALHTPGHTMESTCYLLSDENGRDIAIFTGDTLFIGDVGRPDLAQKEKNGLTKEKLAGLLYHSLRDKILPLANDIIVYPAHGAGSACGKNMSKETSDTLGHQKSSNYALQPISEVDFITQLTEGLLPPPAYFPENVHMNKEGYEPINQVLNRGLHGLGADEFEQAANATGALIIDTRQAKLFAQGFIPNAINIGIDGSFAPWVGALITDIRQPILIIAPEGREEEVITRLARVGYDYTIGFLKGGFQTWADAGKETNHIPSISPQQLAEALKDDPQLQIVDVRKPDEYEAAHVRQAVNVPLEDINILSSQIDPDRPAFIHCAGGYRSMVFTSILRARGFSHIQDISGGFQAIHLSGIFNIKSSGSKIAENQIP